MNVYRWRFRSNEWLLISVTPWRTWLMYFHNYIRDWSPLAILPIHPTSLFPSILSPAKVNHLSHLFEWLQSNECRSLDFQGGVDYGSAKLLIYSVLHKRDSQPTCIGIKLNPADKRMRVLKKATEPICQFSPVSSLYFLIRPDLHTLSR
jgi:hypothetical protein